MSTIENTEYVLNFRSFYRNLVVKSNVVDYYSIWINHSKWLQNETTMVYVKLVF